MDFGQNNSSLNMTNLNEAVSKPKLVKKTNLSTQKVEERKSAPLNNSSIGFDFTLNGQALNNVEEKVAHLSLQMNQIIVRPYLQQALEYLKTSKRDSINAYNQLSDQIANEIRIISQNTQQISTSLKEAQDVVAKTQEIIRNKYNNAIEEEISSGALNLDYEYNIVAEHYELSLQLTQELSKYKSRIDSLLSTQAMLDEAIVPSISRLQLEIDNIELLLQSFDSSDYAQMLAKKTGTNIATRTVRTDEFKTRSEELNRLAAASSINSLNSFDQQNNVNLNNMNTFVAPNNQRIDTKNYNMNMNQQNMSMNQMNSINSMNSINMNSNNGMASSNNMQPNVLNNSYTNVSMGSDKNYNDNLSRQELKLMRKLREQQMKFDHMMKMNELIFQYNRSVDDMILRQKEYELQHREQFAAAERAMNGYNDKISSTYSSNNSKNDNLNLYGSKHIYESDIPLETVNENIKRTNVDKVFVVRQAEPITESQAKEIRNRGSVKSIKVVKS